MSVCVNVCCSFAVNLTPSTGAEEAFRSLARRHLDCLIQTMDESGCARETGHQTKEARNMLAYAAEGHGIACGSKGHMFSWAIVGNYTRPEDFIEALKPFFVDLYNRGFLFSGDGIIVISQREQFPFTFQAEIRTPWWDTGQRVPYGVDDLIVTENTECSFPLWGWYGERRI